MWDQLNREIVACCACPRLVEYRQRVAAEKRRAYGDWDYWGKPVPGFGDVSARVVLLGLAPGAHGANRTGRMFTGDGAGVTLVAALHRAGLASQASTSHRDDGLQLHDVFMTAVVRCAPPGNKPTPQEIANCRPFLARELALLNRARLVVALGRIAFDGYWRLLREQRYAVPRLGFRHGAIYALGDSLPTLVCCYHPSRQNTQTGRLTEAMLDTVLRKVKRILIES